MSDMELLPCPFCGGAAEIRNFDEGENAGGSCVSCTRCMASGNVEFGRKENFISNWNFRKTATLPDVREIFGCGQQVLVGGVIQGVIEEVIFARNMTDPFYLVEWWHDGDLRGRRFHECELEAVK